MQIARSIAILTLLTLHATGVSAGAPRPDKPTVIVVVGAEGAPEYGPMFAEWADRWIAAANKAQANVVTIGRADSTNTTDLHRLRDLLAAEAGTAPSTLPTSGPATLSAATQPSSDQPLWLVLIGHGTYDGRDAKFNLRGPDLTDKELAEWLAPARRPLAIINSTSSSAPFLNRLSGRDRVVIVATRSGSELQFARFGDYMSRAVGDPSADLDKDGQTSLLEAYIAASHQTEAFYKEAGRLATEHALLDDNGDALGTPATWFEGTRAVKTAKSGASADGHRAHQWHLVPSPAEQALSPQIRARRDELELQIRLLRDRKPTLPEADYYAQLEPLLLDLAGVYAEAEASAPPRSGE